MFPLPPGRQRPSLVSAREESAPPCQWSCPPLSSAIRVGIRGHCFCFTYTLLRHWLPPGQLPPASTPTLAFSVRLESFLRRPRQFDCQLTTRLSPHSHFFLDFEFILAPANAPTLAGSVHRESAAGVTALASPAAPSDSWISTDDMSQGPGALSDAVRVTGHRHPYPPCNTGTEEWMGWTGERQRIKRPVRRDCGCWPTAARTDPRGDDIRVINPRRIDTVTFACD